MGGTIDEAAIDAATAGVLEAMARAFRSSPEFWVLCAAVKENPADAEAVRLLADWVEENGGEPLPIRRLEVKDGDLVVIRYSNEAAREYGGLDGYLVRLREQLMRTGATVRFAVEPPDVDVCLLYPRTMAATLRQLGYTVTEPPADGN